MHITLLAATSRDGFISRSSTSTPHEWTSDDDANFLHAMVAQHSLLVMGSGTYNAYGPMTSDGTLRVILTRSPNMYAEQIVEGKLEFTSMTPAEFVSAYESTYASCLVLGGSRIYEQFLTAGVVNELYITVEPITLGDGVPLLASGKTLDQVVHLPEPTTKALNKKGTVLMHYDLKKELTSVKITN